VTIRDIVSTYIYPNTLKTLLVNRAVLKEALERSAEYFTFDENGRLCISESFLRPVEQHFNYDYISGIEVTIDIRRETGNRVTSIKYHGEELANDKKLTLCMNNYRATGAGGYGIYANCEIVREQPTEISELIIDYVERHGSIIVDKTKWLNIIY
jgi:2',3'-cyclic-nucleotide 2'-phosphodiesterase / 3'-nucleotidase